jgi:hypothetical protein
MDQTSRILGIVFGCIGPCLLAFSVVSFFRTRNFLFHSAEVNGKVTRLEPSKNADRVASYDYAPVFSFTAANGKQYTVISNIASNPPDFSVGESVRVRYDPANPQTARIHTFLQTWGSVVISGTVGAGFVAFGCWRLGLLQFR